MRIVLLLDRPFARRERTMLARLEIGLADEGVRVVHAVPRAIVKTETVGLYSSVVGYEPAAFPIPLAVRARALAEALADGNVPDGAGGVDVVHAMSPGSWRLALAVARRLGAGVGLEVWSNAAVGLAREFAAHPARPVFTVADEGLRTSVQRLHGATVLLTPWGVHGESIERPPVAGDRAVAVMLLVDGSHPAHLSAALTGLAAACAREPRLIAFINTERARGHAVWRELRRLGLTDRVTLITDAEARRDVILNLDALLIPEPAGRLRSMVLDAMACGMPVLAAADTSLAIYADQVTARLIPRPEAGEWESALLALAGGDESIVRLRRTAAEWVGAHRSASAHVASVLRAYETIAALRGATPAAARA